MKKHFVYAHWLANYPMGNRCISYEAEFSEEHTAESLHKLLGDRRAEWRPCNTASPLETVEHLLKTLMRDS